MDEIKVSENIKSIRSFKNLTQKDVADRMGITQVTYSNMESGKFSLRLNTLVKIAAALDCELSDLLKPNSEKIMSDDKLKTLTEYFNNLNNAGKDKIIDLAELLTEIDRLKK